jgi:hypothetical protein
MFDLGDDVLKGKRTDHGADSPQGGLDLAKKE